MIRSAVSEELRSKRPTWWPAGKAALRILLVDDEIEQLLPLADRLRRAGLVPTIATSRDEAFYDLQTSPPDVVLLDAKLADRRLLAQLRAMLSTIRLVLMSGALAHGPQIGAILAITGVTYIEKPVDPGRLLGLLSNDRGTAHALNVDGRRCSCP